MTSNPSSMTPDSSPRGSFATALDGRPLPLAAMRLEVAASNGLATVCVRQTFVNPYREALNVLYQLPLPADGVVSAFAFTVGDRRAEGRIEERWIARNQYDAAREEGQAAALLEQVSGAVFLQEVCNLAPGAELVVEVVVDQPLLWTDGGWEWRFPTTIAPRFYEDSNDAGGKQQRDPLIVPLIDGEMEPRLVAQLVVDDAWPEGAMFRSRTHSFVTMREPLRAIAVMDPARLDRDIVVSWSAAKQEVTASVRVARPAEGERFAASAFGLVTLMPPSVPLPHAPRDLVVLLDASGSMDGEALDGAKRVVAELIRSLEECDTLELMAFAEEQVVWREAPCAATAENKASATQWIRGIVAHGGTHMHKAICASLASIRADAQRQVVLISDGLVGDESQVMQEVSRRLPPRSRLHVIGVGPAPNRGLTHSVARAGRGLEAMLPPGGDALDVARRVIARTAHPLWTELRLSGSAILEVAAYAETDVYEGAAAFIPVRLRPEGGAIVVEGNSQSGPVRLELVAPPVAMGTGDLHLMRAFGRSLVSALQVCHSRGVDWREMDDPRDYESYEADLLRVARAYGISSPVTSWIAVDPTVPEPHWKAMSSAVTPHEVPSGFSVRGIGLNRSMDSFSGMLMQPDVMCSMREPGFLFEKRIQTTCCLVESSEERIVFELMGFDEWLHASLVAIDDGQPTELMLQVDAAGSTAEGPCAKTDRIRLSLIADPLRRMGTPKRIRSFSDMWRADVVASIS